MYHRLDGKLVAVGSLDILYNVVNSGYFIYDPEFKFLSLGVVGAIREIEFMRKMRLTSQGYKWYVLGDMVSVCPKVNYKLQYQPGYILCPRTKKELLYNSVAQTVTHLSQLPIASK